MGIQRDGAVGEDGEAVIVYFGDGATSQGDVNEAFIWASVNNAPVVFFCQNNQWAISEPLERQSRHAAVPAGARLRLPRRPGRRQRRARLPGRDPQGDAGRARGPGADADRGVHLPDGRAHHDRRPDPVPAVGRAGGVEAEGPDRAGQAVPDPVRAGGDELLRRDRGRGRRGRRRVRAACLEMPDPAPTADVRQRLRRRDPASWPPSAPSSPPTWTRSWARRPAR